MTISKEKSIIIVGAGIFGLSCAYACARSGMRVQVIDAGGEIGQGASGGIVGAMAPHTPDNWNQKKQFQFEALLTASKHWADVEKLAQLPSGYGQVGRIQPILTEKDRARAEIRIEDAKQNWGDGYAWSVENQSNVISDDAAPYGIIRDSLSARIYPLLALNALAKACTRLGVNIEFNKRITGFDDHQINGPWGSMQADAIILAAGYDGFHLLDYHLGAGTGTGVKGQAALLDIDLGGQPVVFADGIYIIAHENGTVAVGATSENSWGQPFETDHQLDEVIAKAVAIQPQLGNAKVIQRWAGLRPKAKRRDPMIGPLPDIEGIWVATGAFKIGFGIAHKVGKVMATILRAEKEKAVVIPESFTVRHHIS